MPIVPKRASCCGRAAVVFSFTFKFVGIVELGLKVPPAAISRSNAAGDWYEAAGLFPSSNYRYLTLQVGPAPRRPVGVAKARGVRGAFAMVAPACAGISLPTIDRYERDRGWQMQLDKESNHGHCD